MAELGHDLSAHDLGVARRIDSHGASGRRIEPSQQRPRGQLVRRAAVAGNSARLGRVDKLESVAEIAKQVVSNAQRLDRDRAHVAERVDELGIEAEVVPHNRAVSIEVTEEGFEEIR